MTEACECSNCGAAAVVVRGSYRFEECGLPNVYLQGVELIRCKACGNEDVVIPRANDVMRLLAAAVVLKPYPLKGEEVRFLRKFLKMTGDEFARLLHIDKTNLSKWENNHDPVGAQSDRLIRLVAVALGGGMKVKQEEAVRFFSQIQDGAADVRIDMNPKEQSFQYA